MPSNRPSQWLLHGESGKNYRVGRDQYGQRCYEWEDGQVTYSSDLRTGETPRTTVTSTGSALRRGSHASTTYPLYEFPSDQRQYTYSSSAPTNFHARVPSSYSAGSDQLYTLPPSRGNSYNQAISDDTSSTATSIGHNYGYNASSTTFSGPDHGAALASGLDRLSLSQPYGGIQAPYSDIETTEQEQRDLDEAIQQSRQAATTPRPYYTGDDNPQEESSAARTQFGQAATRIRATAGVEETLDPRYHQQRRPKEFFRIGRVFAMLWHETAGSQGTVLTNMRVTTGKYGEAVYTTIRRMVVVKEGQGACWCIPITTYNGRGTAKPGLTKEAAEAHAIIYMSTEQPARLQLEDRMIKRPIAVNASNPRQRLDRMSRVNFLKVYTVEHYVKVMDVGVVARDSMPYLVGYWRNSVNS